MNEWVITTVITLGIGVVSYFLKRTMSQVDRHDTEKPAEPERLQPIGAGPGRSEKLGRGKAGISGQHPFPEVGRIHRNA